MTTDARITQRLDTRNTRYIVKHGVRSKAGGEGGPKHVLDFETLKQGEMSVKAVLFSRGR